MESSIILYPTDYALDLIAQMPRPRKSTIQTAKDYALDAYWRKFALNKDFPWPIQLTAINMARMLGMPVPIRGAASGFTTASANAFLLLFFNATTWANVAINATSSPITNVEVSLHTADPGAGGSQTTSEATYTSYARVAKARSGAGWTVTSNAVVPASDITFPVATGGGGTATWVGFGTAHSGAGVLVFRGQLPGSGLVLGSLTIPPIISATTSITLLTS